jgi:RNA polymerase sigma factor (sigma-70 family)
MSHAPDAELLGQFAQNRSETAFAELVERHIGLVHSVALRHTANPQHAQDITQAVFIILARKAASLGPNIVVAGWLYHTARLTVANFQRAETRRIRREHEAFMQSTLEETAPDPLWRELSPLLDDAMADLRASDRDAIVLRFFQNQNLADVGAAMGIAERAAQKRVDRALEKLRKFFTKRGVVATAAIIAGAISAHSVQAAPAGLANTVTAAAIAKGAAASASTVTLVNGVLKAMAWAKAQIAVIVGAGILLTAGVATEIVKNSHPSSPGTLPPIPSGPQVITMNDGTKLTLLGTTHGNRHYPPHFPNTRFANMIYTGTSATTVVWIQAEYKTGNWSDFFLFVYDASNTACVRIEKASVSHVSGNMYDVGFVLSAFPRWDKEFLVRVAAYGQPMAKGEFLIANRDVQSPPVWTPETLPATNSDGNLQVTLTRLVASVPEPYWPYNKPTPTNDLSRQGVHIDFNFTQNGKPTTNWFPWMIWTSDAVSNLVDGAIGAYATNDIYPYPPIDAHDGYFYKPGLWPGEPWKVRLEFTQRSGFSDDEIVTFTNIPVKAGTQQDFDNEWTGNPNDFPYIPVTVNSVHLKLLPPLIRPGNNSPPAPDIEVIIGADVKFPERQGLRITILEAKDDQGRDLWSFNPSWAGHWNLEFARVPDDVKTLTLKLALHKSRFVEFTVQPTKQ